MQGYTQIEDNLDNDGNNHEDDDDCRDNDEDNHNKHEDDDDNLGDTVIIMKIVTIIVTMMVDLNESEGHGDQAETEVGHGEIGDEHVPKRNNKH